MPTNRKQVGIIAGSAMLLSLAIATVSQFEGRELRAYQDIVGVWTICYGETRGVKSGDVATPAQCSSMLAKSIAEYEAGLDRCLTVPTSGKTKVALVSWAYNVGVSAACKSTLVRIANTGNLRLACEQLLSWTRAGGRVVQGLINRRQAERALCIEGLDS